MRLARNRVWRWLICGLVVSAAGGCAIVADLFDPALVVQFGLDPATITPQQGSVIVAFRNTTRYPATFLAFRSVDQLDLTRDSRNFSVQVDAGEVGNEVLDCPVGVISPGSLDESYSLDALAAIVEAADETSAELAQVEYSGQPLESGDAYSCGDVVEIRLSATGTDDEEFVISVRVIPG